MTSDKAEYFRRLTVRTDDKYIFMGYYMRIRKHAPRRLVDLVSSALFHSMAFNKPVAVYYSWNACVCKYLPYDPDEDGSDHVCVCEQGNVVWCSPSWSKALKKYFILGGKNYVE